MTSTKVGSKSHNSENRLQTCSAIKKSHYPDTKRIYEKLDKLEERFRLLEEEIDDLTDKALEIKWEIDGITTLAFGDWRIIAYKKMIGKGMSHKEAEKRMIKLELKPQYQ
ncbi:hypothetical protein Glove_123g68 [Diversispora epigaea]|uniref:Uncharacterized protein n=1 Tax=Diversispora epigaea TaxID=1348612 RepID=A0A397IYS2_9GLOM|nr:hypothetical protein Glove_123g68 [Diversispora epigaea]